MNCKGCKYCQLYKADEWIPHSFHFCSFDDDGGSISESWKWCKGRFRVEKVEQKAQNNMARERKKPEGSFIERAKNEIENEDTLLTNRAYELGRIRGRKETIEKAYEWFQYNAWSFGNYAQGDSSYEWEMAFECFRKTLEE